MTNEELSELLGRMRNGDKDAFKLIYDYSITHVFRTVSFLVNEKQDAFDVVNEVYAELFRSLQSYNFQKPFRSWLNGLIVRQSSNWNRKNWRRNRINDRGRLLPIQNSPDTEHVHMKNEESDELIFHLKKLPYNQREVIVLRYYQDCSFEEIANILDIPVGTAKSRHHSAIENLRKKYKKTTKLEEGNSDGIRR